MTLEDVLKSDAVDVSHIGDIEAKRNVLGRAENSYVKGDVEASGVLEGAKNSHVEGNVEAEWVLGYAENSHVEGNVEARDVLEGAKNSYVDGNVEAGESVLTGAKNSHVEGNVEAEGDVLENAKNSYVKRDVEAGEDILWHAKNSHIEGNVKAKGKVLLGAENSYVKGDVEAGEDILWHAKNSHIEGNVEAEEDILWHAKNSHILSDTLRADSIGLKAKGGMVAAKEIDDVLKQGIGTGLTILTQSDIEGAVKYNGNWNELSGYISEQLKRENFGDLESLALFKIEKDKISNLEDFKEELALLSEDYALVKDAIKDTDLEEILDCNNLYSMSNKMKMEVLSDISTVLKKHNEINFDISSIFKIFDKYSPDVIDYLIRRNPEFIIDSICKLDAPDMIYNYLRETNFGTLGNKKIKSLIELVQSADLAKRNNISVSFDGIDKNKPAEAAKQFKEKLLTSVNSKYGLDITYDTLERFGSYLRNLEQKSSKYNTLIKGVLNGSIESKIDFKTEVQAGQTHDTSEIKKEFERLYDLYKTLTGTEIDYNRTESTLIDFKTKSRKLLDSLGDWEKYNPDKDNETLNELKPNLERLSALKVSSSRKYTIGFSPEDYEGQLEALAKVQSCLSPGASNFKYTKNYLTNTNGNVFFATIRNGGDRLAGRATIAIGYDSPDRTGQKYVARVSRIYPESTGITKDVFDSALQEYAKHINAKVLDSGNMYISGIGQEVYDDYLTPGSNTDEVRITSKPMMDQEVAGDAIEVAAT